LLRFKTQLLFLVDILIDVVCLMVFSATFNLSWWSVLLVEETGGHGENHRPVASHWQTWSHNTVHDDDHWHDDPYSNRIRTFCIILSYIYILNLIFINIFKLYCTLSFLFVLNCKTCRLLVCHILNTSFKCRIIY
jgi:hypothetical protein